MMINGQLVLTVNVIANPSAASLWFRTGTASALLALGGGVQSESARTTTCGIMLDTQK